MSDARFDQAPKFHNKGPLLRIRENVLVLQHQSASILNLGPTRNLLVPTILNFVLTAVWGQFCDSPYSPLSCRCYFHLQSDRRRPITEIHKRKIGPEV